MTLSIDRYFGQEHLLFNEVSGIHVEFTQLHIAFDNRTIYYSYTNGGFIQHD